MRINFIPARAENPASFAAFYSNGMIWGLKNNSNIYGKESQFRVYEAYDHQS
jgi:hypothetical protein